MELNPVIAKYAGAELNTHTSAIISCFECGQRNNMKIAQYLGLILNQHEYASDFASFEEYAEAALGLKKAQAYNLANVGTRFGVLDENGGITGTSIFAGSMEGLASKKPHIIDFSVTQLLIMSRATKNDSALTAAFHNGDLRYEMTVKEMETVCKKLFPKIKELTEHKEPLEIPSETDAQEEKTGQEETPSENGVQSAPEADTENQSLDEIFMNVYRACGKMQEKGNSIYGDIRTIANNDNSLYIAYNEAIKYFWDALGNLEKVIRYGEIPEAMIPIVKAIREKANK